MNKGIWYAIGAYMCWGLLPLYWKMLRHVPAPQLLSHRIIWSFVALLIIILVMRQWKAFQLAAVSWRIFGIYLVAALLVGTNWLTYVWAVNAGHVVESSLGYFINPLISVLFGVIFFREHLRAWQWVSIGAACFGVLYLTFAFGKLPWIALTLAFSFGSYGLIKKIAPLGSVFGMMLETSILLIPALAYLFFSSKSGNNFMQQSDLSTSFLLVGAGLITTIPLLMFATASRRIPLSLIGILQYIAPTLQFFLGILVFREVFSVKQFFGYSFVWVALFIYGIESYLFYHAKNSIKIKKK